MKLYLVSLAVGILAGILYGLLNVRSPAPPVVALIGLLGMLIGEQAVPFAKQLFSRQETAAVVSETTVDQNQDQNKAQSAEKP
ncbi:XapX domain-containing protein [Neisseria montereyensis]|uniref:XapX domain-containing protein n=1 Tax=Neisseria montereyensis TaxID=2973938 RepID=A0ABT2FB30_9NEIS|nr:XapX domain-containing protein [Neisseria montereyensis]MCS4533428.1 XapX domain-containing protein [Neisseria montereyensis]